MVSCPIPRSPLHEVHFFPSIHVSELTLTDDTSGLQDVLNDPPDPADVADADAYEELINNNSTPIFPNQTTVGKAPEILELTEQYDQSEAGDQADLTPPQTSSALVTDQFPFGNPGMPIPEKPQGSSVHESWEATSMDSPWAPFQSELDWNMAQWAKMHGRTATEFLAIPGVCVSQ